MLQPTDTNASSVGSDRPIGIIGAGMAGLTLALALHRQGRRVVVIEARARDHVVNEGAFLTLAPNGLNALRAINLFERVASLGVEARGFEFYNERGRHIGTLDFEDHRQRFGAPSVTLKRGDLSGALLAACLEADVEVRFDTTLYALQADPDGVTAQVGDQTETFDMLVGADGLRSRVRSMAFAGFPEPAYSGLGSTAGVTQVPAAASTEGYMRFIFGRQAFFGYLKMGDGPVFWFDTYNASKPEPSRVSDPEEYGRHIAALHGNDPLDAPMIARASGAIDRRYAVYDVPDLPRWHEGRIVLIGDAAHALTPHSGQGASMAIEDAIVLAATLQTVPTLSGALADYERIRRPRTAEAARVGRRNGAQKVVQGWLALRVRDVMLPLFIPLARRAQERLYRARIDQNPCVS